MAQIMKAHLADPGSLQRPLKPLAHLTAVKRMTCMRAPEHEIVFGLIRGESLE
jgi:hypothetical protein